MQLRDHPIMSFRGYSVWPPIWIDHTGTGTETPRGEIGVLLDARRYPENPRRIFITIKHNQAEYTGCLLMEYQFACDSVLRLLNDCSAMSIKDIGSVELPLAFGTFRRANGSQTWHHSVDCSHWPQHGYEQRTSIPDGAQPCNQCKTLAGDGSS
jgi:hypothetical protein